MDDFRQVICCNKVAKLFEIIKYDISQFIEAWLQSEVNRQIIEYEPAVVSQGVLYWKELFSEEYPNMSIKEGTANPDAKFWIGYILTYMQYTYHLTGEEIWNRYNILDALDMYDVLHTQSSKIACEDIMKNYIKE